MGKTAKLVTLASCVVVVVSCVGNDPAGNPQDGDGGPSSSEGGAPDGGADSPGSDEIDGTPSCPNGTKTTLTGIVRDPSGTLPIYGAIVYVPAGAVGNVTPGVSGCERCGAPLSGGSKAAALTDATGRFVLANVPVGDKVPVVVQIGKWRRQAVVKVDACVENVAADAAVRLPKSAAEGDLPRIAATTGAGDALPCLLRKIGIDATEFTVPSGSGHVHLYAGAGGSTAYAASLGGGGLPTASSLWASLAALKSYDLAVFSCEANAPSVSAEMRQNVADYLAAGGRLMLQHYEASWLSSGPGSLPATGTFNPNLADLDDPQTFDIDTSFPKGKAFAEWLSKLPGAKPQGKIQIGQGQHNTTAPGAASQRWIHTADAMVGGASKGPSVQLFTANVPVGGDPAMACGRVAMTDIHASPADNGSVPFPDGCTSSGFTEQERALAFSLFDLASCIQSDAVAPKLP